ncbi:hypothetical protein ACA910_022305 [Epithemia clementina (nom. ined.)]
MNDLQNVSAVRGDPRQQISQAQRTQTQNRHQPQEIQQQQQVPSNANPSRPYQSNVGRGPFRRGPPPPPAVHTQSGVPFGHVPAYLPGSASLVEELDQRLLIVLRDGKHIVGTMISYDQFSNMILQDAVERRVVIADGVCYYHDIPLGLYILRGDSTVLMGQLDMMRESHSMKEVELDELENLSKQQDAVWDFDSDLIA